MTESTSAPHGSGSSDASPMIYFGGMLGIAACSIGIAIFLAGCFGFGAAFSFALLPMAMSAVGLISTIIGGVLKRGGVEHTSILAGVFVNIFGLVGGLIEVAFWHDWTIFPRAG